MQAVPQNWLTQCRQAGCIQSPQLFLPCSWDWRLLPWKAIALQGGPPSQDAPAVCDRLDWAREQQRETWTNCSLSFTLTLHPTGVGRGCPDWEKTLTDKSCMAPGWCWLCLLLLGTLLPLHRIHSSWQLKGTCWEPGPHANECRSYSKPGKMN